MGNARPIRIDQITRSPDAADKVLPAEQDAKARPINTPLCTDGAKTLAKAWQEEVATKL